MKLQITKEDGLIMKAVAILFIALHNMAHSSMMFIPENESRFNPDSPVALLNSLLSYAPTLLGDILSFLGWYGVPVFIFLSGYGLVMKYERKSPVPSASANIGFRRFFLSNYIKLIALLLPMTVILLLFPIANNQEFSWGYVASMLFQQTLLNDFVYVWLLPKPGVYWYFGLTMQLYLVYWIVYRKEHKLLSWFLIIVSIVFQIIGSEGLLPKGSAFLLVYMRHNFIGWLVLFVLGIYHARTPMKDLSRGKAFLIFMLSLIVFFVAQFNSITWQLTPIAVIPLSLCLARVIQRSSLSKRIFVYVGTLSPYIFVVHPIVRNLMCKWALQDESILPELTLYMVVVVLLSMALYKSGIVRLIQNKLSGYLIK